MCDHTTIKTPNLFDALGLIDFGQPATNQAGFCEACGAHRVNEFVAGYDRRGNAIKYINNRDGTWTNLLNEVVHPDEFVNAHFAAQLWKW